MKKYLLLSSLFFIVILVLIISGCDDLSGRSSGYIITGQIGNQPQIFINITDDDLFKYPHLWESINSTDQFIDTPRDEWFALKNLFGEYSKDISFQNRYYHVRLVAHD